IPSEFLMSPDLHHQIIQLQNSDILGFYYDFSRQEGLFNKRRPAVGKFSEGLAPINVDGKWGFINTRGHMAVQAFYNRVDGFSEGFAPVLKDQEWFYINPE